MTIRVIIGTILVAVTMMITAFVLVNEPARMSEFEEGYLGRSVEAGAIIFANNCATCHGINGQGIDGVAPALNSRELFDVENENGRLAQIGWAGTVRDYVKAAVAGGRPRASVQYSAYPNRMPTWSQEFGGPLRPDQVENVVDFVMNWETTAMLQTLATATPNPNAVGTDLNVELPEGDVANGELLFKGQVNGQYPCSACHSLTPGQTLVGPSLGGIATTAETRTDLSAELYIHESIVSPNAYVVEGFAAGIMPQTFGQQMSKQDLADILAFLMTQQ
jgi:mono/diheme cytochrome c family protein